ncbi:hypothetical protein PO878_20740 [Iamia majanohamensis]|uniref:GPI inositol-deacylase PGAP1-like alpha/beta domain-containing protein n=1 Tax=Iamia majanohamensis TaxID=467976 RepID=A0AAF0BW17_9ACTN|nr:hypothetical protein [Iamia majanohamensis]WCO66924.1 hypothetical protein PO878_20740 [Iamia majanohamensis]
MAVLLLLVSLVVGGATAAPSGAASGVRNRPVLLVHGYSLSDGTDCGATFDRMISQMRSEGFTGPFVKVGFYSGDTNCNVNLRSWGSFGDSSSWKAIAKAFSKYVSATYTAKGIAVDVVGYSMGGNIARGAVYGSSIRESGFSAPIRVEDVVTLGTPHKGAAWYTYGCLWGQCSTLKPSASDIAWLNRNGNPQGVGGTDFTVIGSNGDWVVSASSATSMSVPSARKVVYADVPHTGSDNYMGRTAVVTRAGNALALAGT